MCKILFILLDHKNILVKMQVYKQFAIIIAHWFGILYIVEILGC